MDPGQEHPAISDDSTITGFAVPWARPKAAQPDELMLTLLWSVDEPHRVGEALLVPPYTKGAFGRAHVNEGDANRLILYRLRPEDELPTGSLITPHMSRDQAAIERRGHRLHLRPMGRCPMRVNGHLVDGVVSLVAGDVVEVEPEAFERAPDNVRGVARDLIRGIYKLDRQLLLILDVERTVEVAVAA